LNAVLTIELVPGTASGAQQVGLDTFGNNFSAAASTIRGLVISRFGSQIQLGGGAAHRVEGNFFGRRRCRSPRSRSMRPAIRASSRQCWGM
jgi:hypothetical protein